MTTASEVAGSGSTMVCPAGDNDRSSSVTSPIVLPSASMRTEPM